MKVVVVTNGSLFATIGLRRLFVALEDECQFHVVITNGLRRPDENRVRSFLELARRWGVRYTAYKLGTRLGGPLYARLRRDPVTVSAMCAQLGIPVDELRDINAPEGVALLRAIEPAVLVSYACPYRIGNEVLDIASIISVNAPSSLLPAYAGVSTYVHVLSEGQAETGVTVHEMVERFDAGRIFAQESVRIVPGMSVAALFALQHVVAGELLIDVLRGVARTSEVDGHAQDLSKRSYRREPTRKDIGDLRRRGHRLVRWREVGAVVRAARSEASRLAWDDRSN